MPLGVTNIGGGSMTMLLTRMHEFATREGVEIEVTRNGKALKNLRRNGVLNPYPYKKKLPDAKTVSQLRERFESANPGYSCNVLKGDGKIAVGQTLLGTVRATYE